MALGPARCDFDDLKRRSSPSSAACYSRLEKDMIVPCEIGCTDEAIDRCSQESYCGCRTTRSSESHAVFIGCCHDCCLVSNFCRDVKLLWKRKVAFYSIYQSKSVLFLGDLIVHQQRQRQQLHGRAGSAVLSQPAVHSQPACCRCRHRAARPSTPARKIKDRV